MGHIQFKVSTRGATEIQVQIKDGPLRLGLQLPIGGSSTIQVGFEGPFLTMEVVTEKDAGPISALRNEVTIIARALSDSFGYLLGRAIPVDIYSAKDMTTGEEFVFADIVPSLANTTNERPVLIHEALSLSLAEIYLRHALSDLREAVLQPLDVPFHCFRAVECVRQAFVLDPTDDAKLSWVQMSKELKIAQSFAEEMREHSISNRHGTPSSQSGEKNIDFLRRAWKIVDRYVAYIKCGKKTLDSYGWLD